MGHSWDTVPGIIHASQHPEKVSAYVGIAQVADVPEGRRLSYHFALSKGKNRGLEEPARFNRILIEEVLPVG
jgi:proline iminopeptidase